ncbi:MAG: hypothetical protein M1269_04550 [Chloroflexi bacterium]|nr:hypothetical protein [Chloroflexota bacterium]
MNKRRMVYLAVLLFLLAGITVSLAAKNKIVLYGRSLNIITLEKNGVLYVPLDKFCKELNIDCIKKDGVYHVGKEATGNFKPPAYKYFLNISNTLGEFEIRVFINDKIAGDFTKDVNLEVTNYLHKGDNDVVIQYNNLGEGGGYDITIDEKIGDAVESKINFSMVWTEESKGKGDKKFTFEVQ